MRPHEQHFATLGIRANGAALALSVVGASSLFSTASFQPQFVIPAWIFLVGVVFGYALIAVLIHQQANSDALDTIASFRKTQYECERESNPSEAMIAIGKDCRRRADEMEAKLMTEHQEAKLVRATNWMNNLSLGCFVLGVIFALVMLGRSEGPRLPDSPSTEAHQLPPF